MSPTCEKKGLSRGAPSRRWYSSKERRITVVAGILLAASGLMGCKEKAAPAQAAPPDVEVVDVVQKDVPISNEWVGTLDGFVNADIRAQVSGYLIKQDYTEGLFVKKDALLFEIDPRPFQAAMDQAQGNLQQARGSMEQAKAKLDQAKAQQGKTALDVKRYTPLAAQNAISRQELDDAVQADLAAVAGVAAGDAAVVATKASIESAQAAVNTSQLNLNYTRILAPVDGVVGIAKAQIGDLVGPSTGELTTISTIDPIKCYAMLSEQDYMAFARLREEERRGGIQHKPLDLELILADGSLFPEKGKFLFADRQVDVRTGALRIVGSFPNPGNILRPGQFGRLRTDVRTEKGALLVPQRAVSELQGGYQVAVVGSDNKATIRPVKVGARVGQMWVIKEGVKAGERVIAEGMQRVREGMPVNPVPFKGEAEGKK